jgi:hypothetical protein
LCDLPLCKSKTKIANFSKCVMARPASILMTSFSPSHVNHVIHFIKTQTYRYYFIT